MGHRRQPRRVDTLGRKSRRPTGCAVVLVDYRLAPEHEQFPSPSTTRNAALEWVNERIVDIVGAVVPSSSVATRPAATSPPSSLVVAAPWRTAIALQALIYPVTDADVDNSSTPGREPIDADRSGMVWFWDRLPARRRAARRADVSPLRLPTPVGPTPGRRAHRRDDVSTTRARPTWPDLAEAGVAVAVTGTTVRCTAHHALDAARRRGRDHQIASSLDVDLPANTPN